MDANEKNFNPGLSWYIKIAAEHELLEPAEEKRIFKMIKEARTNEEYIKLRNEIIYHNLRLVINVAKNYNCKSGALDALDLIQEGNLGLIKAIAKFKPEKKYRFSTYAVWWIKQVISRAIADYGRTVKIPVHIQEKERALARGENLPEETIKQVKKASLVSHPLSLESNWGILESENPMLDFLEDLETASPEDAVINDLMRAEIEKVINSLSEKEREVIMIRFGFYGEEGTLQEAGKKYGISRERVRQIQNEALAKLRHPARRKKLEGLRT